jgi:hypothetical protein
MTIISGVTLTWRSRLKDLAFVSNFKKCKCLPLLIFPTTFRLDPEFVRFFLSSLIQVTKCSFFWQFGVSRVVFFLGRLFNFSYYFYNSTVISSKDVGLGIYAQHDDPFRFAPVPYPTIYGTVRFCRYGVLLYCAISWCTLQILFSIIEML